MEKRGQVTIFIIISIVLVVGVILFFIFRENLFGNNLPADFEPVYETFVSCVEENLLTGSSLLGSQGGYIEIPDFEPGSDYMPFSSQLNFLGTAIPYWYYVSGNNIQKTQVPSKQDMENELENFIESKIIDCSFDQYYRDGFNIILNEPQARVRINEDSIDLDLNMVLEISRSDEDARVSNHDVRVESNLGSLYESALEVYNYEQETLFLETYGVDVLRSYAPVDGVEISCSPQTWKADEVFDDLENAIESNTLALKTNDNSFVLQNDDNKYFVVDVSPGNEVRFLNSKEWPKSFEVTPSEGSLLLASPVGNQPGTGALGFCYVPYHFVYDLKYPILVQVYDGTEIFQFPLAIVIMGNKEREPAEGAIAIENNLPELCEITPAEVSISVLNNNFGLIDDAEVSFECFGTKCTLGRTVNGVFEGNAPECVNGFVIAQAEGYETKKSLFTSVGGGTTEIFLDREYDKEIELSIEGVSVSSQSIITFTSPEGAAKTVIYPENRFISLSEGQYEVQVQVYRESQLRLPAVSRQECVDVPRQGVLGILGLTEKKCFDVEIPSQIVSNALSGGGSKNHYILESELSRPGKIIIDAQSLPNPVSIEQLQSNYVSLDKKTLSIGFR